jgi:urease accessory protein
VVATDAGAARCFDLTFRADGAARTFIGAQFVRYPMHICRAHRHEAMPGVARLALQSVSGGLFEGERVHGRITAQARARAIVGTSASTIVHSMKDGWAEQSAELAAAPGAVLAYLPEPSILFPASRLRSTVTARAEPGGAIVFCESFLAHDPAGQGQGFAALDASVIVTGADGRLLARERFCADGPGWLARRAGLSGGFAVHAGLWLIREGDNAALLALLRQALDGDGAVHAGASELPNRAGLQARLLCTDAVALRRAMARVQALLCEQLMAPARAEPIHSQPEGLSP